MSGRRSLLLGLACLAAIAIAAATLAARPAAAAVYWGAGGSIGAANGDGTMAIDSYPYGIANTIPQASVCGVAVNATHLFWADSANGAIGTMQLSNTANGRVDFTKEPMLAIDQALVANVSHPCGVAVDAGHLYWANTSGSIGRSNLDGSAPQREFIAGLSWPCGVAVDGSHIYWGDVTDGAIGRANLDGSGVEPEFIPGAGLPCGVAVSASRIYWSSEGPNAIGRADLDGGNPEPGFIPLAGRPCGVAVDAAHVYWANRFEPGIYLSRANLDGSGAAPLVAEPFYAASCGVALDSRTFQPPPPPASLPIRLGPVKRQKQGRLLVIPVYVPERGQLALVSPRIGWGLDMGPEPPPFRGGVFRWKLKLWPGSGPVGKRIRRQLEGKGKAPVDLNLSWEQLGRAPVLQAKHLAFVDPR